MNSTTPTQRNDHGSYTITEEPSSSSGSSFSSAPPFFPFGRSSAAQPLPQERVSSIKLEWNPEKYQRARDRLIEILERYELWEDPFSLTIFRWSSEVLPQSVPDDYMPNEAEMAYGTQKIDELRRKVLVGHDMAPLHEPVLKDQHVWEKWQLLDFCQTLINLFPDEGVSLGDFERHTFAEELLDWLKSLFDSESSSSRELAEISPPSQLDRALITQDLGIEMQMAKLYVYTKLVGNSTTRTLVRENLRYPLEEANQIGTRLVKETKKLIRLERQLTLAKEQQREEEVDGKLEILDETHESETTILQNDLDDTKQRKVKTEKRAEKAEITCAKLKVSNAQLTRDRDAQAQQIVNLKHDLDCAKEHNRVEFCRIS